MTMHCRGHNSAASWYQFLERILPMDTLQTYNHERRWAAQQSFVSNPQRPGVHELQAHLYT